MSTRVGQPILKPKELLDQYGRILGNRQISWLAERPLGRCLGVGGQGVVYLSERKGADGFTLPVALKFFSPEHFEDAAGYEDEMRRSAQVAARVAEIQQDHLIDVQDFRKHGDIHLMEMEWVDGYDLRGLLTPDTLRQVRAHVTDHRWRRINKVVVTAGREQPRLKPGVAIVILRECLAGVAALHRNGIVHGDLKPSNIMVKRTGNVKIIDIGSAFEMGSATPRRPCTPSYAAPEVLEGAPASPQSDLASLGHMLIEMLSGVRPFSDLSYTELVEARKHTLDRLPQIIPAEEFAYSEPLMILIRGLVHPDPGQRFASAETAEVSEEGATGFLRMLVKSDRASSYVNEIRRWIDEVESHVLGPNQPGGAEEDDPGSTQTYPHLPGTADPPSTRVGDP